MEYTEAELRAGVEAAENWETYVTVTCRSWVGRTPHAVARGQYEPFFHHVCRRYSMESAQFKPFASCRKPISSRDRLREGVA